MEPGEAFEDAPPVAREPVLHVVVDGYEGPLDLLLDLARRQKVDLARISVLALAEQYLAFVADARVRRLELAADWLVMAAWLAYLKSRLLLPAPERPEDEPDPVELAEAFARRLARLEAVREAGRALMARPRLGQGVFARGATGELRTRVLPRWDTSLFELLGAYAAVRKRRETSTYRPAPMPLYPLEEALARLERFIGRPVGWRTLTSFVPRGLEGLLGRSALASLLSVALEMARDGRVELRQEEPFGPIMLRRPEGEPT